MLLLSSNRQAPRVPRNITVASPYTGVCLPCRCHVLPACPPARLRNGSSYVCLGNERLKQVDYLTIHTKKWCASNTRPSRLRHRRPCSTTMCPRPTDVCTCFPLKTTEGASAPYAPPPGHKPQFLSQHYFFTTRARRNARPVAGSHARHACRRACVYLPLRVRASPRRRTSRPSWSGAWSGAMSSLCRCRC